MNANEREYLNDLARRVVGAAYEVSNVLGAGFLEKVYERALAQELRLRGIHVETQVRIPVTYKGSIVGDYYAGILVEGSLIIELKCVECFRDEHMAQCINYMRGAGKRLALLLSFQHAHMEWKRVVLDF